MAKKKENTLTYLQMPLPDSRKSYRMTKRTWSGLNYRHTVDSGALSMERNISTLETPYLVPSQKHVTVAGRRKNPISLFAFDDFLIVIYRDGVTCYIDYITFDEDGKKANTYTGILRENASENTDYPRCVVQFNVYDTPTDPVGGKYVKKLLIFPDKKSMDFEITEDNFTISDMDVLVKEFTPAEGRETPPDTASHYYYYRNSETSDVYRWVDDDSDSENSGWKVSVPPAMPNIKYAAVHLSRLFGVDDDRVYASGYNDYTNWNLDTVDEYNESNAWCSPAQSNTKAGGRFTGITNFQGHVVCFKSDYMHEIYNTKNPFRIQDIYAEGAIDNRTIQDVDGKLIFVSEDGVKIYTGSNPRILDYTLNMRRYTAAVSGTDGRCYYLYCEDADENSRLFVYDTIAEQWSEQNTPYKILSFAHNKFGMFALTTTGGENPTGRILKLDSGEYLHDWSFETDLITNETVNIKHIKKIQMLADVEQIALAYIEPSLKVYVLYDDEEFDANTSHLVYSNKGKAGKLAIRVKPRQTASYGIKLHVEGFGYVKLYEMELFMETGGDLYV